VPPPLRVAAGVLHYRFWPEVRPTLDRLLAQDRQPDEIVVVDHASGDGSVGEIRSAYPQLEVVELPDNRGPAGGMNRMLQLLLERPLDAILFLPHDLELAPSTLERLAERLETDPTLGAVGPLIAHRSARERVFYAGGYVHRRNWDLEYRDSPAELSDWAGRPPQPVDFLELGGLLVRADVARTVGGLPEHFYYVHDDLDFTLRIARHGWRLECVPAAVAWQDLGDPTGEELLIPMPPYLQVRNRLGLIARNAPRRMLVREILRVLSWLLRDAIRPRGSRAELRPRLRGLVDFCLGRWGPPP
jgi:GT2 family glycosyltransferase